VSNAFCHLLTPPKDLCHHWWGPRAHHPDGSTSSTIEACLTTLSWSESSHHVSHP
jgi:hypothetical protein